MIFDADDTRTPSGSDGCCHSVESMTRSLPLPDWLCRPLKRLWFLGDCCPSPTRRGWAAFKRPLTRTRSTPSLTVGLLPRCADTKSPTHNHLNSPDEASEAIESTSVELR